MTQWVPSGEGTFYRPVKRARRERRCDGCGRLLEVGAPYVEHRALMWSDVVSSGRPYSVHTCGIKTYDCPEDRR